MEHPRDVSAGGPGDILSRLSAMEERQETRHAYNTTVLAEITQRVSRMDDKLHTVIYGDCDKPGLITRVDRVERQLEMQERRTQPWRQGLVILAAGLLGGFISWVTVEALHIEQRLFVADHQHSAPP